MSRRLSYRYLQSGVLRDRVILVTWLCDQSGAGLAKRKTFIRHKVPGRSEVQAGTDRSKIRLFVKQITKKTTEQKFYSQIIL